MRRRTALLALAPWWLAACATRPRDTEAAVWTTGRLSLRVDASAGQAARSLSAGFELRGDGDQGELRLSTPLGTLLAAAKWAPGEAVLSTPEGQRRFDDLGDLSRQALGEALPLQALPAWLAGRPWPGAPSQPDAGGFEQLGWRIGLLRLAEGWVEAARSAAPAVLLRARLDSAQ